jgi:hypothetical protein
VTGKPTGHRKTSTPEPVPVTTSSYVTYTDLTLSPPGLLPLSHVLDDDDVVIFPVNAVVGAQRLCVPIGPGPQSICTVGEGGRCVPAAATGLDRDRRERGVRLRVA